jgi:3',5'-cyclic AMP phosphodiesterase CpdA
MARIIVTSDLHLGITTEQEIQALTEEIADAQPDLIVLAGDIGEGLSNIRACLRLFTHLPGQVAVLMGNHDLWAYERHATQTLWEELLPQVVRDAGMLWLEETVWLRDGVAVVGSMSWYDYSAVDPAVRPHSARWFTRHKRRIVNDARYITWAWSDQEAARSLGDALAERALRLEDDATVQAVMVVTHVPIFRAQMVTKPGDRRWGVSNAYFGNLTLGYRLTRMTKLRGVVSGHTHCGREGVVERPFLPPLSVSVVASDYHRPAYVTIESDALLTDPT